MAVIDVSKDKAHRILGHSNEEATVKSAKHLGWNLTGSICKCNSYYVAKAKQEAVPNISTYESANKPGVRFYLDLSKIKKPENLKSIGKSNWLIIADKLSKLKFSLFFQMKNRIIQLVYFFISIEN